MRPLEETRCELEISSLHKENVHFLLGSTPRMFAQTASSAPLGSPKCDISVYDISVYDISVDDISVDDISVYDISVYDIAVEEGEEGE